MKRDQSHDRGPGPEEVQLRAYVEALFRERDRAMDMASEEREKAAVQLRVALVRTIDEGDDRLREHITNQVQQIQAALTSADKLEQARISSVQGNLEQAIQAQKEAVIKSEAGYKAQFASANEWRGQSADRERSQQEAITKLSAGFMPREVADAQISEIKKQVDVLQERQTTLIAAGAGSKEARTESSNRIMSFIAVGISLISTVSFIIYAISIHHP